jgi:lycopene cyclase domain-containing protein
MEYTVAALILAAGALGLTAVRGGLADRALWVGLAVFAALTVIADSMLVRAGVFGFGDHVSGLKIVAAPVEDLLYGGALYLVANAAYRWRQHA